MPLATITPLNSEDSKRLRDIFHGAGYTDENLLSRLGSQVPPPAHHHQFDLIFAKADGDTSFQILAKLFFLGLPVECDRVNSLFPFQFVDNCLVSGLIVAEGSFYKPRVTLVPVGELLLAADLHLTVSQDDGRYVQTVSQPALHVSALAVRDPVQRTLDLCGGFGLHGIIASEFSESVVTSDLNPRAAEFAVFNAALNGCTNMKSVTGGLFQAVEQETFDLILSNPPFVISPECFVTFRDSPCQIDGFIQQLFAEAPKHLNEGGILQVVCEWVEIEGQDWQDRLADWFRDNGCDVWVLSANRELPSTYARGRLRETTSDPAELAERQEQWEKSFCDSNVSMVYGGFIFLRRRQAENWFDVTQITKTIDQPIGVAIQQGFEGRDLVFCNDGGQALLASRLAIAKGLRQVANSHWEDDRWQPDSITLQVPDGLAAAIWIDGSIRNLVETFNGSRSVAEVLELFASEIGIPLETARDQGLEMVREMIKNGVLIR